MSPNILVQIGPFKLKICQEPSVKLKIYEESEFTTKIGSKIASNEATKMNLLTNYMQNLKRNF